MNPRRPVMMNASYQPHAITINGTNKGVASAPMFVPELNRPVERARSFFGNHSATVFIDAGKLPASPIPSRNRATINPTTDAESVTVHGAAPTSELIALKPATTPLTSGPTI